MAGVQGNNMEDSADRHTQLGNMMITILATSREKYDKKREERRKPKPRKYIRRIRV